MKSLATHPSSIRGLIVLVALGLLPGCGGGTAAALGGGSSSGGSTPTTVSNVTVSDSKNSPAEIKFTLAGKKVGAVHIEFLPPPGTEGGSGEPVQIVTLGANDVSLSKSGETNQFDWAFAGALGTDFVDGLVVRVRLENGASATTPGPIAVGNSPPVISPFSFPATEVGGVVGMLFTVADTDDIVSLSVEVNSDAGNGFPEGSWETALPDLGQELVPFMAVESGTTVPFHWDVVGQYGPLDSAVMVRATAVDTADPGAAPLKQQVVGGSLLLVDNNVPPVVSFDDFSFALSQDQLRGIVVPYTVSDAEGDTSNLVFQWTLAGQPFVDLPDDETSVQQILDDPALREQFRIATPFPMPIGGLARPTGDVDTIELPELGSTQSHLLQAAQQPGGDISRALDGYVLELLRPSKFLAPLSPTWADNPLDGPVIALPTGPGTGAYVLDQLGGGSWRVSEIDLATGAVLAELANGIGDPDTMTMERGGAALLVAAHDGNVPSVCRVDLDTLDVRAITDRTGPLTGDSIRGLASLGSGVVLATSGDELLRLDYTEPNLTTITSVLDGLATPWGVVVDPVNLNRVYLAERDFAGVGRVLSLALNTLAVHPLSTGDPLMMGDPWVTGPPGVTGDPLLTGNPSMTGGPLLTGDTLRTGDTLMAGTPGLPHPECLAIERGARLLVLTDEMPFDGTKELRALQLGNAQLSVITTELPDSTAGVAGGQDGLRLVALVGDHDLAAGGGVVQRRTIVDYDRTRRVATVDAAFDPPLASAQSWRIASPARLAVEAGVPRSASFVWDSRDVPGGQGQALLRLTARDADASVVEHDGGKPIQSSLAGAPVSLGGLGTTDISLTVEAADLNGDGDLDLVCTNFLSSTVTVFFQKGAGIFDSVPSLTLGGPGMSDGPHGLAVADLDGDGDLDLVSANSGTPPTFMNGTLTVFFQTEAGVFDPVPSLTLGAAGATDGSQIVAVADLDEDGDLDLVSTSFGTSLVTVFFQTAPGVFDSVPSLILGGPGITDFPFYVATADLDGDGDLDLVTASDVALVVFFQTAPGVFDPVPSLSLPVDSGAYVAATDLDGDGDADLVSSNTGDTSITVFFQTAPGIFDPVPSLILGDPVTTTFTIGLAVADVDGDGDADIFAANTVDNTITVFTQGAAGVFDPLPALTLGGPASTNGVWNLAVADLDGNGTADIVSGHQFTDSLSVFFQTVAGVFDAVPSQTLGGTTSTAFAGGVAAADLDGDGDTDFASANLGVSIVNGSVTVFFQTQTGVFDPQPSLVLGGPATTEGAADLAAADLDGDGDVDLVSANGYDLFVGVGGTPIGMDPIVSYGLDTLTVFFQTAPGVFDPAPSLTLGGPATTDGATSVEAADLDGDGDLDLVSANARLDTLTVFFQTGSGVFDPAPSLTLGGPGITDGAFDVTAADLDGDGDVDLVSANGFDRFYENDPIVGEGSDTLTVFFQTAPGVFDPAPSLTLGGPATTEGAVSVTAADVDGDGDLDLISANAAGNTLTVFHQMAPGVFDPVPSLFLDSPMASAYPQCVTAADLDGDGDTDLVSAERDSNTLTVFTQRAAGVFEPRTFSLSAPPTTTRDSVASVTVADLDGDGDVDIVSGNGNSANLTVFYGSHEP